MTGFMLFHQFSIDRGNGVHNMGSDTFKLAFTNTEPDIDANTVLADIVEIAAGGGYPSGGLTLPIIDWSQTGGLSAWKASNVTLTPTADVGPFQWIVVYNSTPLSKPLVGYFDRGTPDTLHATGDPFVIIFSMAPIILLEKQVNRLV